LFTNLRERFSSSKGPFTLPLLYLSLFLLPHPPPLHLLSYGRTGSLKGERNMVDFIDSRRILLQKEAEEEKDFRRIL
jgi:hypothetical protein